MNTTTENKVKHLIAKSAKKYNVDAYIFSEKHKIDYRHCKEEIPYHIASVGKVFTTVTIIMLVEEKKLSLHDKIADYLDSNMLARLFLYQGVDYAAEVTIEQLLSHTSGCADYFEGKVEKGSSFIELFFEYPDKLWNSDMTIDFSREYQKAIAKTGDKFLYSDTGYNLLGKIIEAVTGKSFHVNLHERFFIPLEMNHSYLMYQSKPKVPSDKINAIWVNQKDISKFPSLSCDWAGGGIVSTISDMLKFSVALHQGKVISKQHLDIAMKPRNKYRFGIFYGLGMMAFTFSLSQLLSKRPNLYYGHTGFFGTHMYYDPRSKTHIILNFGNTQSMNTSFQLMSKIFNLLK